MMRLTLLLLVRFTLTSSESQDDLLLKLKTAVIENNAAEIIALANAGGNINASTESGENLIHLAVKTESNSSIAALGFLKANFEALNDEGSTPMEEAIRKDNAACIKELLLAGAKIEKRLFRGDTYLHLAASEGKNEAIIALLDAGHEIDPRNFLDETPLELALIAGNAEGVDILLQKGADAKMVSRRGKSPMLRAIEAGDVNLFKTIIESGMPTDLKYENGETLTHLIVRSDNSTAMLKVLRGRKILLDDKNENGLAPLHIATNPSTVVTLLNMGADVNVTAEKGETALHIASAIGNVELARVLIQHNAGINLKDSEGNTPLMNAVKNSKLEIVTFLLFSGADPRIKNKKGWTALHYAAEGGHCDLFVLFCAEVATVLIEAGAGVNDQDIDGFTPAFVASINDKIVILRILVRRGADLNIRGTRGAGIIHEAAYRGLFEIVNYLLHAGVQVDSKDSENGWTALHYAVMGGRKKVVTLLLDRGADPKAEAVDNRTPLQLAFEHRRLVAAKLLIERGA